jgi:hypothetical protein
MPLSEGFRLREAAEVRFFPGNDPNRFSKLLTIRDLDSYLAGEGARVPRISLADSSRQGGASVPEDEYTLNEDGQIDLPRLLALYDRGATLVLSQLHEAHLPLAQFCRGLERIFLHSVQCNTYLTPPGAQGFRVHYDTHDVLILQVQGEKLWRYWSTPPVPFANNRTPWESIDCKPQGEPLTQMMRPGDVLYVPRGILHDAAAQGAQSSMHLTIGLLDVSWGDALRAALDIVETQDPSLRHSFPTWRLAEGGISDGIIADAARRLAALGSADAMEMMSQQLLSRLARERMPMLSRGLIAPTLSPTDRLYLSDTVHHFVVPRPDGTAELRWAGANLTLTARELDWLTRLDEGVTVRELGDADALAFCQKLAGMGLVAVQPVTAMKAAE